MAGFWLDREGILIEVNQLRHWRKKKKKEKEKSMWASCASLSSMYLINEGIGKNGLFYIIVPKTLPILLHISWVNSSVQQISRLPFQTVVFVYILSFIVIFILLFHWGENWIDREKSLKWKAIQVVNSRGFVSSVEATLAIEKSSVLLLLNWGMNWLVFLPFFWYAHSSHSIIISMHTLYDSIMVLLNTLSDWILFRRLTIVVCLFKYDEF